MSKPFIPSQLGMRFVARKKQHKVKLTRSHSPPPSRTPENYCDSYRRLWAPFVYTKSRSRSVQPKRMPHSDPIIHYRLSNWMEDLMPIIHDKPITQIKMPGTHDSATYAITGESRAASCQKSAKITSLTDDPRQWTMTQKKSIAQQLEMGSRFFDLRVSFEDKEGRFFTHHGLLAKSLPHELKAVSDFLEKHPFEFLIIKIKPASTCAEFLRDLRIVIHKILGTHHILMKATFMANGDTIEKVPADLKMYDCAGRVMVIIDDRTFVEGKEDCPEIKGSKFLFGNTALHSIWPNQRNYDKLVQATIDSQPPITNKQLYCLHFTFTTNVKYLISHMSSKNEVHDIYTMTKKLEERKSEKTGSKSNWAYLISLLQTRPNKRDININVVDFLNGMKSHRVIFLNYPRHRIPPLPPPLKPNVPKPAQPAQPKGGSKFKLFKKK